MNVPLTTARYVHVWYRLWLRGVEISSCRLTGFLFQYFNITFQYYNLWFEIQNSNIKNYPYSQSSGNNMAKYKYDCLSKIFDMQSYYIIPTSTVYMNTLLPEKEKFRAQLFIAELGVGPIYVHTFLRFKQLIAEKPNYC